MNKCQLFIILLTATPILGVSTGALLACDQCEVQAKRGACQACDDRGILDGLNALAHRLQPRLPKAAKSKVNPLDRLLRDACSGRVGRTDSSRQATCGCETSTSCGCEIEASCGCEMEPSCGCEQQPSCGCEMSMGAYDRNEGAIPLQAAPAPVAVERLAPQLLQNKTVPHTHAQPAQPMPSRELQKVPESAPSSKAPNEVVPLPDNEVDPFRDEGEARIRRIPARPVHYQTSVQNYGNRLDPQASKTPARVRMTDEATYDSSRLTLDANNSSRLRSARPDTPHRNLGSSVVTASGSVPQRISATPNLRLQPREETEQVNPLRN